MTPPICVDQNDHRKSMSINCSTSWRMVDMKELICSSSLCHHSAINLFISLEKPKNLVGGYHKNRWRRAKVYEKPLSQPSACKPYSEVLVGVHRKTAIARAKKKAFNPKKEGIAPVKVFREQPLPAVKKTIMGQKLLESRPQLREVCFLHNNARPKVGKQTCPIVVNLG